MIYLSSSLPKLHELIGMGDKERLEDLLCQDYPEGHVPYTRQEAQEALHLLTSQPDCDIEILQWLIDAGVSLNENYHANNTSVLHKVVANGNVRAAQVKVTMDLGLARVKIISDDSFFIFDSPFNCLSFL